MAFNSSDFEITDLSSLNADDVAILLDQIATRLQELNPTLDLKRGVFKDTLAYYHAVLEASIRTNLDRYQSARSLKKIEEDPTLADDAVVDEVLSNWGVTRKTGTQASGSVTIELSKAQTITVPEGSIFQSNGKNYVASASFIARTAASQVSVATDRLLVALSNGNWAFTVDVVAEVVGSDYKLNAGDLITPVRRLANYVTSYATSSFDDGTNVETNTELLTQLQNGIAAKTLSNRATMKALISSLAEFSTVTNQSIVGFGDSEMIRDQHSVLPISFGGRVDWYLRTQRPLKKTTTSVEATLIEIVGGTTSLWQFSLGKDVFPGLYEVTGLRNVGDSLLNEGFEITSDSRGYDLTADGFLPDIKSVEEAAYSAFQTTTIQFLDTTSATSGLAIGDKKQYSCEISGMPLIKELQAYLSSREVRSYAADVLVKAPIPCFVEVSLNINKTVSEPEPDIAGIKNAIVNEINDTGFTGRLDASLLIDRVHGFIANETSVTDLELLGRLRRPDGVVNYLKSSNAIVIPQYSDIMVSTTSSKTVQFFSEVSKISVNVQTSIPSAS